MENNITLVLNFVKKLILYNHIIFKIIINILKNNKKMSSVYETFMYYIYDRFMYSNTNDDVYSRITMYISGAMALISWFFVPFLTPLGGIWAIIYNCAMITVAFSKSDKNKLRVEEFKIKEGGTLTAFFEELQTDYGWLIAYRFFGLFLALLDSVCFWWVPSWIFFFKPAWWYVWLTLYPEFFYNEGR